MKFCFPVQHDEGIKSKVFNHFGSAAMFLVVDSETGIANVVRNNDQIHAQGACNHVRAINNQRIDVVVLSGIGAGALSRLNQLRIRVYYA